MKEHPILFNSEMVRAILDGRKTQTRRPINHIKGIGKVTEFQKSGMFPDDFWVMVDRYNYWRNIKNEELLSRNPFGAVGDRLWVRETFATLVVPTEYGVPLENPYRYKADGEYKGKWTPSIHMPRCASRILLEVVDVRIERLNDISKSDAIAEGLFSFPHKGDFAYAHKRDDKHGYGSPQGAFKALWMSVYGDDSLSTNPYIWVCEFKVLEDKR